jgi:arginase
MAYEIERRDWDLLVSPWHLDERVDGFPAPSGGIEVGGSPVAAPAGVRWIVDHYRLIADATARADRPLLLSGDCLTALGAVAGVQRRHDDVALVWLDAHGDFNTPQITVSGYLAGMSLAMLTGRSPQPLCEPLGLRPVPDGHVVLLDARDLDPAEQGALEASDVRRVAADPPTVGQAVGRLRTRAVYLHVDVDIVDGGDLPGLRFPVGDGPTLSRVEGCLSEIVATVDVVAACIACTWSPDRIGDAATQRAISRIAEVIGAELRWATAGTGERH